MDTLEFFKALADENRQTILRILREVDELSVNELCERLRELSQPTVSHHLQVLRQCRLVEARKVGKHVFYQLNRVTLHAAGRALSLEWSIHAV